jgi:hypothetical protein
MEMLTRKEEFWGRYFQKMDVPEVDLLLKYTLAAAGRGMFSFRDKRGNE